MTSNPGGDLMTVPLKTLVPDRRQLILPDHLYSTAISTESTNIHIDGA
jgi:hypothetical protein